MDGTFADAENLRRLAPSMAVIEDEPDRFALFDRQLLDRFVKSRPQVEFIVGRRSIGWIG